MSIGRCVGEGSRQLTSLAVNLPSRSFSFLPPSSGLRAIVPTRLIDCCRSVGDSFTMKSADEISQRQCHEGLARHSRLTCFELVVRRLPHLTSEVVHQVLHLAPV